MITGCCNHNTTATPRAIADKNTKALKSFWPGNTKRRSIKPCNFANAISEPENEIAPISAPTTAKTIVVCENNNEASDAVFAKLLEEIERSLLLVWL